MAYNTLEQPRRRRTAGKRVAGAAPAVESPAEWVARNLGFAPDWQQARVLESESRRGLLNCTRQWGKSTVTAAKAVHRAWHVAGSLTLVVSPSGRQSGEFMRKAAAFARRLGVKTKGGEMELEWPNGSRIVGLPESAGTIRGFSAVSLLLVDEAARVTDEMYKTIRPMLAVSDGTLWLMSTPCGKRGFFWEAWERGGAEWERIQARAEDCPRIPRKFLEEERRSLGERWYRQEYGCEFTDADDAVFATDLIERAISSEIKPLNFGWWA